ncbi:hypothetical protein WISP_126636 [Willisornis vidua]|uniref:Uncharacterized protein n=1 Tax=Willisornis vidua TaxID=1566151 RepID=A0ABQ9CR07_9PASS|nr:hypothetical protein WISP_126636 [Willisornis vidua]
MLRAACLESSLAEKSLGVLVNTKVNMSQQCTLTGKSGGKAKRTGTALPGEEKALGTFNHVDKYQKGSCKADGAQHLSVVSSDKTRDNGHKQDIPPEHEEMRMTEYWHGLPREVESLSLELLKSCLDMALGNQLQMTLLEEAG